MCIRDRVKAYSVEVIKTIRAIEPNAVILVGCPHWDQDIHLAADDPITVNHIDCPKENIHILNGNAENLEKECRHYEQIPGKVPPGKAKLPFFSPSGSNAVSYTHLSSTGSLKTS